MKETITKLDLNAAFKALDEIDVPQVEGLKPNRVDLKETFGKKLKTDLLVEDYYDVANREDLEEAKDERDAEIAKAKLARIEKIVDLDAQTAEDLLPSYVGKVIIQCPQCMTLFYKDAEDIVHSEENPDIVNVDEVCQHCGNTSGYSVIGKVDAVSEEEADNYEAAEDLANEDEGTEEDELDLDFGEPTEEVDAEGTGEGAEEDNLTEISVEDDETKEESFEAHTGEVLNEDADLNKQLSEYNEYVQFLQKAIEDEEAKLAKEKNELVKKAIQRKIDDYKKELEEVLPKVLKDEAATEDLPTPEELAADAGEEKPAEEKTESLNKSEEAVPEEDTENHSENLTLNEETTDESLNNSEVQKDAEEGSELKTENESENLTLNEEADMHGFLAELEAKEDKKITKKELDEIATKYGVKAPYDPAVIARIQLVNEELTEATSAEDKEAVEESLNNSEAQKDAEEGSELKTENESENLTLNEGTEKLVGFIDLSGGQGDFEEPYTKIAKEKGATEIRITTDPFFKDVENSCDNGKCILITCDDDIKYNRPELLNNPNLKVIKVDKPVKESLNEGTFDELPPAYDNELPVEKGGSVEPEKIPVTTYFLDCSGSWTSHGWEKELAEIEQLKHLAEKGEAIVKVYYFSDKVYDNEKDAWLSGSSKGCAEVARYAHAHPEEKCIVRTDDDYKYQGGPEGKQLEVLPNVELRLRGVNESLTEDSAPVRKFVIIDWSRSLYGNEKKYEEIKARLKKEYPNAIIMFYHPIKLDGSLKYANMGIPFIFVTDRDVSGDENGAKILKHPDCERVIRLDLGEDFTGTPEIRTTHLEYEDKDPTDGKAVLPDNLGESFTLESLEEIDEKSVEECIKESLTNVYENVDNFELLECSLDGNKLSFDGKITFKSGANRNVSYVFTEANIKENTIELQGLNESLDKNSKFILKGILEESNTKLTATELSYNYKINDNLVEGLIKRN